ncbi:MAG TPA: hypothetical protein VLX31_00580 [Streptosporangiaceae bacterium]|nr:hypothetical protein [Streptosporangiaceae bacterium]
MIRRLAWLGIGALLGVIGYRRAVRLVRAVVPQNLAIGPTAPAHRAQPGQRWRASGRAARRAAGGMTAFVRDVRTGMADYLDASGVGYPDASGVGYPDASVEPMDGGGLRRPDNGGAYMNRQPGRLGNTLVGQHHRWPASLP